MTHSLPALKRSELKLTRDYVRNIAIVFAVCGLWHGAAWHFIAWGLAHAVIVLGYHYTHASWDHWPRLLQRALTFGLVAAAWTLFRYDFGDAAYLAKSALGFGGELHPDALGWLWLAVVAVVCFRVHPERWIARQQSASRLMAVATARPSASWLWPRCCTWTVLRTSSTSDSEYHGPEVSAVF